MLWFHRGLINGCGQSAVEHCFTDRTQCTVFTALHAALAVVVNDKCALLSLLVGMVAQLDEGFNYELECVYVVVPQYQLVEFRGFFLCKDENLGFSSCVKHGTIHARKVTKNQQAVGQSFSVSHIVAAG